MRPPGASVRSMEGGETLALGTTAVLSATAKVLMRWDVWLWAGAAQGATVNAAPVPR